MESNRLEAFSDGVLAIIITIMVLELKAPHGTEWKSLVELTPVFLSYVLSFIYVGLYWNNHHHLLKMTETVNGTVLWANLHFLFWLSLIPFAANYLGENHFATTATTFYGIILFASAVSYAILIRTLLRHHQHDSAIVKAIGEDRKSNVSLLLYIGAIGLSSWYPFVANIIYVLVALIWFVPNARIERALNHKES